MSTPKPIAPSSFADIFLVQQGWGVDPSTEVFDTNFAIFGHGISQKKVWPLQNYPPVFFEGITGTTPLAWAGCSIFFVFLACLLSQPDAASQDSWCWWIGGLHIAPSTVLFRECLGPTIGRGQSMVRCCVDSLRIPFGLWPHRLCWSVLPPGAFAWTRLYFAVLWKMEQRQ